MNEAAIRDYLADHLELIEEGLRLIAKEFKLPNAQGAKGSIDILAEDSHRHRVIIELKRSDQTARQALHELHKYVALLRQNHGLPPERLRCILASTHWHELRVPFSDYARGVQHHVEGRHLLLDSQGLPVALERVEVLPEPEALRICPHHLVFLFEDAVGRERALGPLQENLRLLRAADHVCVLLDHQKESSEVCFPFAIYVAVGRLGADARWACEQQLGVDTEELEEEDPEWFLEQSLLGQLAVSISSHETNACGPDGFVGLQQSWKVTRLLRSGRFESRELLEDEELQFRLGGGDGDSSVFYAARCSPRFQSSWRREKAHMERSLLGNDVWRQGLHGFVQESERELETTLTLQLFNPMDLLTVLREVYVSRDDSVLPRLQVVREEGQAGAFTVLMGRLEWDGATQPKEPERLIREACERVFDSADVWAYQMARALHETWMLEPELLHHHGLRYALAEFTFREERCISTHEVVPVEGRLERRPLQVREADGRRLQYFIERNQAYLDELVSLLSRQEPRIPS